MSNALKLDFMFIEDPNLVTEIAYESFDPIQGDKPICDLKIR